MPQYYFDSKELKKYLDTKAKLKVFVDGQWLKISSVEDIEDAEVGVGQTNAGESIIFDYRDIQQVKAGQRQMSVDQLQKKTPTQKPSPEEEPTPDTEEPTPEDGESAPAEEPSQPADEEPSPEEEESEETPGPVKSGYDPYTVGRQILKNSRVRKTDEYQIVEINDPKSEHHRQRGIITSVFRDEYEVRLTSSMYTGRIFVSKQNVKLI